MDIGVKFSKLNGGGLIISVDYTVEAEAKTSAIESVFISILLLIVQKEILKRSPDRKY